MEGCVCVDRFSRAGAVVCRHRLELQASRETRELQAAAASEHHLGCKQCRVYLCDASMRRVWLMLLDMLHTTKIKPWLFCGSARMRKYEAKCQAGVTRQADGRRTPIMAIAGWVAEQDIPAARLKS